MSNNIDYENFYNKIFFTIVRANFPKVFDETVDETITDETIKHQNFINSIKKNNPDVFYSTKRKIEHGISDIDSEIQYSKTSKINNKKVFDVTITDETIMHQNFIKVYSSLATKLILDELLAYKNIENITDQQLERFIYNLNMKIDRGVLPMKTAEELEADMKAEAAERALAAREAEIEAEEEEQWNWQKERERMRENSVISRNNNQFKTRLTTAKDKMEAARREAEDDEFARISGAVIRKERDAMAERMRQRQTKSKLTTDATRKAHSGGSRRRRKRKRTRKLRKHYKSRKSSNKYIRRKK